jgi:hypothetical protein
MPIHCEREKRVCPVFLALSNIHRTQGMPLIFTLHICKRRKKITSETLAKVFRKTFLRSVRLSQQDAVIAISTLLKGSHQTALVVYTLPDKSISPRLLVSMRARGLKICIQLVHGERRPVVPSARKSFKLERSYNRWHLRSL